MRPKENCVDPTKVMEMAYENILNEMIENLIEGICFEVHRAVKLGYYPLDEYILRNGKFEIYSKGKSPSPESSFIFAVKNPKKKDRSKNQYQKCRNCHQLKAVSAFARHLKTCPAKPNGCVVNTDKREYDEDDYEDEDSYDEEEDFDRSSRKGNDAKKLAKGSPKYDYMTSEERQDFLLSHCGVVSSYTGRPCSNPIICNKHTDEDKDKVRQGKM